MANFFDDASKFISSSASKITSAFDSEINSAVQSVEQFVGDALNTGLDWAESKIGDIGSSILDSVGFGKALRGVNLPVGQVKQRTTAEFSVSPEQKDWRVKLSVPNIESFRLSKLLVPVLNTGGFTFPFTPTISINHNANYSALSPVHTNYAFPIYSNSTIADIQIVGEFYVENQNDARYWISAVHYLKSITKMFYGDGENYGSPPPVVKLNGYGDYVFKDVPVVVSMFSVELSQDVDYISVPIESTTLGAQSSGSSYSWVPTRSTITVTLMPAYSRSTVSQFNLNDFVQGKFVLDGKGFL